MNFGANDPAIDSGAPAANASTPDAAALLNPYTDVPTTQPTYVPNDTSFGPEGMGRAAVIRDQLANDLGIEPYQAAGIVSNLSAESGIHAVNEAHPIVPGSRGGFGWAQWTGPRRVDFEKWADAQGLDHKSDAANYGYLVHDIAANHPQVLAALRSAPTPQDAASEFFAYESGGSPALERYRAGHMARAAQIAAHGQTTPPAAPPSFGANDPVAPPAPAWGSKDPPVPPSTFGANDPAVGQSGGWWDTIKGWGSSALGGAEQGIAGAATAIGRMADVAMAAAVPPSMQPGLKPGDELPTAAREAMAPVAASINKVAEANLPKNATLGQKIAAGAGGFVPALTAMAINPLVGAGLFASQGYDESYNDALAHGATHEEANVAGWQNGAVQSALSMVPGEKLLTVVGGKIMPVAIAKTAQKYLPKIIERTAVRSATDAAMFGEMQAGTNIVAKANYDPDRSIGEGVPESMAGGALAGSVMHLGGTGLGAVRDRIVGAPRVTAGEAEAGHVAPEAPAAPAEQPLEPMPPTDALTRYRAVRAAEAAPDVAGPPAAPVTLPEDLAIQPAAAAPPVERVPFKLGASRDEPASAIDVAPLGLPGAIQQDMLGGKPMTDAELTARQNLPGVIERARAEDPEINFAKAYDELKTGLEGVRKDGGRLRDLHLYVDTKVTGDELLHAAIANPDIVPAIGDMVGPPGAAEHPGLVSVSALAKGDASINQPPSDRIPVVAGGGGDGAKAIPSEVGGNNGRNVDVDRRVLAQVLDSIKDDEVVRSVVRSLPVSVVDMLARKKGATDDFLRDPAMLRRALAVSLDKPIARRVTQFLDAITSAREAEASASAEGGPAKALADVGRLAREADTAMGASEVEKSHRGNPSLHGTAEDGTRSKDYGAKNKLVSPARADEIRAKLKEKLNRLNAGIDPEALALFTELGVFHIEAGARRFADFAKAVVDDLGITLDKAKPFLRSAYNGARDMMEDHGISVVGMDSPEEVTRAVKDLVKPQEGGNIAPEETANAGVATQARTGIDDRNRDEGASADDVPPVAGAAEVATSAGGEGGSGGAELRGSDVAGEVASPVEAGQPPANGEQPVSGAEPGSARSDRPSDRVPAGAKPPGPDGSLDYHAPAQSLARVGGWRATAERNLDIIELVNKLDAEGRQATPDEQALLVKFTGWGAGEIRNNMLRNTRRNSAGEREIVPASYGEWAPTIERASRLLRGEQLETALQSTQYAHYTSEPIIRAMWSALDRLGFKGGRIMEPGMGTGLFAVAAPREALEHSHYTGIELDKFTAKVASYLLPQENTIAGDFVKVKLPDGFYDVAVGNPPFSATKIMDDPAYKRLRLSLHDYFFAKSIDKIRPGGLMVFVTSRYTMDKLKDQGRQYLADRADLLGAIRLPNTSFKENAGTEVVTDVLFFQKRPEGVEPGGKQWLGVKPVDIAGTKMMVNEYFADNPDMVLGDHALTGSMYRDKEYTVTPREGDIADHFRAAVENLPQNVYAPAVAKARETAKAKTFEADMRPSSEKEGGLYVKDSKVYIRDQGIGVPVESYAKVAPKDHAWLKDYAGLRDALKTAQRDQLDDGNWQESLKTLNKTYDAFVKKHGPVGDFTTYERTFANDDGETETRSYRRFKNDNLLRLDVESPLVESLEKITDDGKIVKGPFLKDRTLRKPVRPVIESPQDALAVSLDEIGKFDPDYIADMLNMKHDDVITALGSSVYQEPHGEWKTADDYLSGDVVTKLEEAKAAAEADPRLNRNVEALQAVQPKPLSPQDINIKLGAGWIPRRIVQRFMDDILGLSDKIAYEPATAEWAMSGKGMRAGRTATAEYGTDRYSPSETLLSVLNNRAIKIMTPKDSEGRSHVDQEATAAANEKAKQLSDRFKTWVWEDAQRASELSDLYNRKFNNLAPRRFDGSHLTTPGLSANYKLYPHQKRAIWRILQTGNTYLNHAVGAGKTLEMIVGGMESKRLGLIKKPMYAVPNHMLNQFAREFLEAYPAANIMVADEKAFHTDNRKRFMARAALNDPDAIIVTHSAFGKIGTKPESRAAIVDQMIGELEAAMEGAEERHTRSKIEKQIEGIKRRFEGKTAAEGKDQALTFEDMGVDHLFVDEAHEFRKLDYSTNRSVKGIDPTGSQRALDLYIKSRWLEKENPGRSMVMASGTPVTNTMAELYTVMRYMDEANLERDGLRAFDAWANMFGDIASGYEQNAAGGYEIVDRFAKFVNVPELMKRVRSFMDVLTSDQLGDLVKRPDVNGGGPHSVVSPPIDALQEYMDGELKKRIEVSRAWKPSKDQPSNPDPIIAINGDARLSSIDMRFIRPGSAPDPGSKLNIMLGKIVAAHKDIKNIEYVDPKTGERQPIKGGTQIVFSSVGFGEQAMKNRGFDLRSYVDKTLIDGGFKKSEIAWMSDANTHAKKEQLFKDMRAGKIKVLFGSPKNMGTGVNVQNRLKVLHYLSPPWYPSDVEQPHGRIIRQGNWNPDVDLNWYATKGTYDSTAWNMVSRKARFIEQAMKGDDSVRSLDDISEANQYEMAAALAAGDDRVIQVAALSGDITRLERLQGAYSTEQNQLASMQRGINKHDIPALNERIALLDQAAKARDPSAPFALNAGGATYDKPGEGGEALWNAVDREFKVWEGNTAAIKPTQVGTYQGKHPVMMLPSERTESAAFDLAVQIGGQPFRFATRVDDMEDIPKSGIGSRLQNAVARIPGELRSTQMELADKQAELVKIDRKLGAPFPQGGELAEKVAERARLQEEMAAETKATQAAEKANQQAGVAEPSDQFDIFDYATGKDTSSDPVRGNPDAVPVQGRRSIRGLGIAGDLRREKAAALVGREAGSPHELADIAQVYRDPRFETMRVFFMQGDRIIHATGVSSRAVSLAPLLPKGGVADFNNWLRKQMNLIGADGYYMLHNHPSGRPEPSRGDLDITHGIVSSVPGFRGHVIINSNKYAVIGSRGEHKIYDLNQGEDRLLQPAIPHPVIGSMVSDWQKLAEVGQMLKRPGNVTIIGTGGGGLVRVVADYPEESIQQSSPRLLAEMRNLARRSGSSRLFLVADRAVIDTPLVKKAVQTDVLTEAMDFTGKSSGHADMKLHSTSPIIQTRGAFVAEDESPFEAKRPDGPVTRLLGVGTDNAAHKLSIAAQKALPDPVTEILDDIHMAVSPMGTGSKRAQATAKDFANAQRQAAYQWGKVDEWLTNNFDPTQRRLMWEAADEHGVLLRRGIKPGDDQGLNRLSDKERAAVEQMQAAADAAFEAAQKLGMVKGEGLESYVPRMIVEMTAAGPRIVSRATPKQAREGANLSTTTGQLRQRKHETVQDTEAAAQAIFGEKAQVVRDIRTLGLATQRLENAIAGRTLVDKIKAMGKDAGGGPLVSADGNPDPASYFTIPDHPALQTWGPRFTTDKDTGKTVPTVDQNGDMIFDARPLWISREFEGPLKAVLSSPTSGLIRAMMDLKGKMMSIIMYSPLMHNAVIWGKAIPADPSGVLTLRTYRRGNQVRKDAAMMQEAIGAGMDPIGHRYFNQDIRGIAAAEGQDLMPGRSWTAQLLAAIPNLFSKEAGDSVKRAVDKAGDVWHNTFLWDRVADLQAGLYVHIRDDLIGKGIETTTAQRVAAHYSNRYAGALPMEGMSKSARNIANMMLFSRSFTLGNLGAYKDILAGMPSDVRAQIIRDAGAASLGDAQAATRMKAISMLVMDVALQYAGLALAAGAVSWVMNQDYQAPWDNEQGRENRFLIRYAPDGTAIYGRLPTGKVAEDLTDWISSPRETLLRKLSPYGRLMYQVASNDRGFGKKLYDPYDKTPSAVAKNIGRIVWAFMGDQLPMGQLEAANQMVNGPKSERGIAAVQAIAPLAGITTSKGAPGGPAMADLYHLKDEQQFKLDEARSGIAEMVKDGDIPGARAKMNDIGVPPQLQNYIIRAALNPRMRLSGRQMRDFMMAASPEQRVQMQEDLRAEAARAANQ